MDLQGQHWPALHDILARALKRRGRDTELPAALAWCEAFIDRECDLDRLAPHVAATAAVGAYLVSTITEQA